MEKSGHTNEGYYSQRNLRRRYHRSVLVWDVCVWSLCVFFLPSMGTQCNMSRVLGLFLNLQLTSNSQATHKELTCKTPQNTLQPVPNPTKSTPNTFYVCQKPSTIHRWPIYSKKRQRSVDLRYRRDSALLPPCLIACSPA